MGARVCVCVCVCMCSRVFTTTDFQFLLCSIFLGENFGDKFLPHLPVPGYHPTPTLAPGCRPYLFYRQLKLILFTRVIPLQPPPPQLQPPTKAVSSSFCLCK